MLFLRLGQTTLLLVLAMWVIQALAAASLRVPLASSRMWPAALTLAKTALPIHLNLCRPKWRRLTAIGALSIRGLLQVPLRSLNVWPTLATLVLEPAYYLVLLVRSKTWLCLRMHAYNVSKESSTWEMAQQFA
jgi:hypothetical protein